MQTLKNVLSKVKNYLDCEDDISIVSNEVKELEIQLQDSERKPKVPTFGDDYKIKRDINPMLAPERIRPIQIKNDIERKRNELKSLIDELEERRSQLEKYINTI